MAPCRGAVGPRFEGTLAMSELPTFTDLTSGKIWKAPPYKGINVRLRAALQDAQRRTCEVARRQGDFSACLRCLDLALAEAVARHDYVAWDNLHQFDIEYLATLEDRPEARRLAGCELFAEADQKLKEWRADAAECLRKSTDTNEAPSVELLVRLRAQLATQSQNTYLKNAAVYEKTRTVWALSLWTILFVLVLAQCGQFDNWFGVAMHEPLRQGVLAAFLGGVISVSLSIEANDLPTKMPQLVRKLATLTWTRPTVGALCAIPVVFLVQSDFLTIKHLTDEKATILFCFITGFSERWFFNSMQHVIDKAKT
jgi:hypothetical protein